MLYYLIVSAINILNKMYLLWQENFLNSIVIFLKIVNIVKIALITQHFSIYTLTFFFFYIITVVLNVKSYRIVLHCMHFFSFNKIQFTPLCTHRTACKL